MIDIDGEDLFLPNQTFFWEGLLSFFRSIMVVP